MKKLFILTALISLMIFSCSSPNPKEKATVKKPATLDSISKQYYEDYLKLNPVYATFLGDERYNDILPNFITEAYRKQSKDFFNRYNDSLDIIGRDKLSENDQITFDILKWECEIGLEDLKYKKSYLMPIDQMWAAPIIIGQLASGSSAQPFKTVKDYDNWLSRLDSYIAWCDTAIVNMRIGIKEGYTIPKALTKKCIPQYEALSHGPVESHLFYSPVKLMPSTFSAEQKARLTKAYKEIVQNKIIPINKKLKDFLQNEYLPACRTSSGIDGIPEGKEFYKFSIKYFTTTSKPADEIFELGETEVARITSEMEKVKQEVGFKGDLKSFFKVLRTKKELMPFTKPEQVIAHFNEIHERMKPNLKKLFDKTPKTPFEVKRTEAFREKSASAEYNNGSQDGKRPGIFYVPIPNAAEYNILSDEDLFLHEAIPGHHYQISLQQEDKSLPQIRRVLGYSAYAEGWALYTESLGKELGLYTDPYQYFGMLSAEMHRAIRLVVDAGLHTKGWTREQAIQYSLDHEAETEEGIISEIERYMSGPGQALSYKIGQLKIIELRRNAEKELGNKFNIAQFHNQVLGLGSVPLKLLEDKIDKWIEMEKKDVRK